MITFTPTNSIWTTEWMIIPLRRCLSKRWYHKHTRIVHFSQQPTVVITKVLWILVSHAPQLWLWFFWSCQIFPGLLTFLSPCSILVFLHCLAFILKVSSFSYSQSTGFSEDPLYLQVKFSGCTTSVYSFCSPWWSQPLY